MKRVTARTGVVEDSTLLTLRRVSATLAPGSGFLSGDYAEVRATEGSGDLSGTDLLLVDGGEGLVGVAVDYDGGPSEVRAVTGDRMNDLLHVTFQSTQRVETDTGAIHGDTILFYQGSVRLVRQSSLGSVFGGQNRQRCGAP